MLFLKIYMERKIVTWFSIYYEEKRKFCTIWTQTQWRNEPIHGCEHWNFNFVLCAYLVIFWIEEGNGFVGFECTQKDREWIVAEFN